MFKPRDIAACRAIISVFESGQARPHYAALALLHDGPGGALQVTFGGAQATDRSDSLDAILHRYRELATAAGVPDGETLADELATYLPQLAENTPQSTKALAVDKAFTSLLVRSAEDPLMHQAQNDIFDRWYMTPSLEAVAGSGWTHPLSLAVVYDSHIHGSWERLRDKVEPASEEFWISNYVTLRRVNMEQAGTKKSIWGNKLLRNTTYRMDCFRTLIAANNWELVMPVKAHGVTVTEDDVNAWI